MATEELLCFTFGIKRKQGVSEADFQRHWREKHGPLVAQVLLRTHVVKYVQYHPASDLRTMANELVAANGQKLIAFDGMADFWVRKFEDLANAFKDPGFNEVIKDEERFIDRDGMQMTVGRELVVIENGKIVARSTDSGSVDK